MPLPGVARGQRGRIAVLQIEANAVGRFTIGTQLTRRGQGRRAIRSQSATVGGLQNEPDWPAVRGSTIRSQYRWARFHAKPPSRQGKYKTNLFGRSARVETIGPSPDNSKPIGNAAGLQIEPNPAGASPGGPAKRTRLDVRPGFDNSKPMGCGLAGGYRLGAFFCAKPPSRKDNTKRNAYETSLTRADEKRYPFRSRGVTFRRSCKWLIPKGCECIFIRSQLRHAL